MLENLMTSYLRPKSWEKDGKIYELLGVRYFFRITPFELRRAFTGKQAKTIKKRADIPRYFRETILAELTHLFSFLFVLSISIYFWFTDGEWIAIGFTVFNIIGNLYPIFLMRYNRIRLMGINDELKL